jgi:Flagellar P-ring protein
MRIHVVMTFVAVAVLCCAGCAGDTTTGGSSQSPKKFEKPEYLGETVGQRAFFTGADSILVQGVGLVTGLNGTGSRTHPPGLRSRVLKIMMRHRVPNAVAVLSDPNTAVVYISGYIAPGAREGDPFDLFLVAAPGTQTTSLEGGTLLAADLARTEPTRTGTISGTVLATGAGELFVSPFVLDDRRRTVSDRSRGTVRPIGPDDNPADAPPAPATGGAPTRVQDPKLAWILGGGRVKSTRQFYLNLLDPSERLAEQIVHHVNARFPRAAKGRTNPGIIDLQIPASAAHNKLHFLDVVGAIYLVRNPSTREFRMRELVKQLAAGQDVIAVTAALEAFGKPIIPLAEPLLANRNDATRFYAAALLARLGQVRTLAVLMRFALDDQSKFQELAVLALGELPDGGGAGAIYSALNAQSPAVRIAAYLTLRRIAPRMLDAAVVPGRMELATVRTTAEPFVYVARSLESRVVVFGDVKIRPPLFVDTPRLLASVQEDGDRVILINKRYGVKDHIETSLRLSEIIRTLAGPPAVSLEQKKPTGLDLSYGDVVGFLDRASKTRSLTSRIVYQTIDIITPDTRDDGPGQEGSDIIIPER